MDNRAMTPSEGSLEASAQSLSPARARSGALIPRFAVLDCGVGFHDGLRVEGRRRERRGAMSILDNLGYNTQSRPQREERDANMGMNVNLTPQLEELVRQKVASGMYSSASEVVREALRLMDEQDRLRASRLTQLQQDIRAGKQSGPSAAWDPRQVKRDGRARKAAKAKA